MLLKKHVMSSEASIDAEPRPAKRRRIPTWEQAQSQKRRCEKCGTEAHQIMDCPQHPKNRRISAAAPAPTDAVKQIREHAFSPLPGEGDTSLPWNQSAESMKLKEQQKKDKKSFWSQFAPPVDPNEQKSVIRTVRTRPDFAEAAATQAGQFTIRRPTVSGTKEGEK